MVGTPEGRLALQLRHPDSNATGGGTRTLCIDFASRALYDRVTDMVRTAAALLRATGCAATPTATTASGAPTLVDATAGTGRDAFTLAASRGAPHVLLLERDARVAALLADAILRGRVAATTPPQSTSPAACPPAWLAHVATVCSTRMTLVHADAAAVLRGSGSGDDNAAVLRPGDAGVRQLPAADVAALLATAHTIYVDPMWSTAAPESAGGGKLRRPTRATPRNDLAILGRLLPPQPPDYRAHLLAAAAAAPAARQLVIKRHAAAADDVQAAGWSASASLTDGDGAAFDVWRRRPV